MARQSRVSWRQEQGDVAGAFKRADKVVKQRLVTRAWRPSPWTSAIKPTEILSEICLPAKQRRTGSSYMKMPQQASGFAVVGVAAWMRFNDKRVCEDIGIGVTGLTDKPFRARAVEALLRGEKPTERLIASAAAKVADGGDPLEYRYPTTGRFLQPYCETMIGLSSDSLE